MRRTTSARAAITSLPGRPNRITRAALLASISLIAAADTTRALADGTTWTGAVSSDWLNASNWTNGVPNIEDAEIGGGTVQLNGTGQASSLTLGGGLNGATLLIYGGGQLTTTGNGLIGYDGRGEITVSGANSVWNATYVDLGYYAVGILTLTDGGALVSEQTVEAYIGSTINIGAAAGDTPAAPGTISAPSVYLNSTTEKIVFNHTSSNYTFDIPITGDGSVDVNAGHTILTADSTYTGDTTINGGTLSVNGSITSLTTINSGGTLGGTGKVGNVNVLTGGTLAPGDRGTIGTLTVDWALIFYPGSTYAVDISPTASDLTVVTSFANLAGGTVAVNYLPGTYLARQYTIQTTTSGLSRTEFAGLTGTLPGFSAALSYTTTDVLLTLTATFGLDGSFTANQQRTANAFTSYFNNGGSLPPEYVSLAGLSGTALNSALSATSGETASASQQSAFQLGSQFMGAMFDSSIHGAGPAPQGDAPGHILGYAEARPSRADAATRAYAQALKTQPPFERRWNAWGTAFGGYNRSNGDAGTGSHDVTARTGGVAAGLDYKLTPDSTIGVAVSGGASAWSLADGLGKGQSDAFQAGLYGRTQFNAAYVAAALMAGQHWISTDRDALGQHLSASFNAQSYGGRIEGGYRLALSGWDANLGVTPYAAVQTLAFHAPAYAENGGSFALGYESRTATDTRTELGARFDRVAYTRDGQSLTLRGKLGWAHDWVSDPSLTASFLALAGSSFVVTGAKPAADQALLSAAADLNLDRGFTVGVKFDGEFSSRSASYAGTATLRKVW